VRLTSGADEIVLVTHAGMSLRFHESDARNMGRASMGVAGIRPREGDFVVGLAKVTTGATLLVASENGLGKRTAFEDYRLQSRGGIGVRTMAVNDKTGPVVGAVTVTDQDELMLMTSTGQSIRIRVNEIRETGRVAQGVKLLTLREGENLQDVAIVIPDGDDESDREPPPAHDGESLPSSEELSSSGEDEPPAAP
jgi:DNA gyrase subunit A